MIVITSKIGTRSLELVCGIPEHAIISFFPLCEKCGLTLSQQLWPFVESMTFSMDLKFVVTKITGIITVSHQN